MKIEVLFAQTGEGQGLLKLPGRKAQAVCTVLLAARRLGRSRRQVYRYLKSGELVARGKVLGEWLLDRSLVETLARNPVSVQPVPSRMQFLFPEHRISGLNAGRDRVLILSRVLESGGTCEVRWALHRYGRRDLVRFVRSEGSRLLSPRNLRLWSLYFGVKPEPLASWRGGAPWESR